MPMDRLNAFFADHKGQRIIVRFEAASPGSSAAQLSYYYNYVLPSIVQALREQGTRMSEERADRWLMAEYPGGFYYDGNKQVVAILLDCLGYACVETSINDIINN